MSRHRIVRSMNYDEERYDDDEYDYGHSYEDRYCISPSTAAQFTFNRDQALDLSSFMHEEKIPEEEETMETGETEGTAASLTGALSDVDRARLHSCLEELHNVLGETMPEAVLTETIIRHNYNIEATLNEVLSLKEAPKPQRTERKRRDRTQEDDKNIDDLLCEIDNLDRQAEQMPFSSFAGRFRFREGFSPPSVAVKGGGGWEGLVGGDSSGRGENPKNPAQGICPVKNTTDLSVALSDQTGGLSGSDGLECQVRVLSAVLDGLGQGSVEKGSPSLVAMATQHRSSEFERKDFRNTDSTSRKSGLSLSELVGLQGKQKMSPMPPPLVTSVRPQKQTFGAVSLTELVSRHSSKKETESGPSLAQGNSQEVVSLKDLVKKPALQLESPGQTSGTWKALNSGCQSEFSLTKPAQNSRSIKDGITGSDKSALQNQPDDSRDVSGIRGISLADLAKRHSDGKSGSSGLTMGHTMKPLLTDMKPSNISSGLSLSDLIKQHHNTGSSVISVPGQKDGKSVQILKVEDSDDAVYNLQQGLKQTLTIGARSRSDIEGESDDLKSTAKGEKLDRRGQGSTVAELSLASCLKKSLKLRPAGEAAAEILDSPETESPSGLGGSMFDILVDRRANFVVEPIVFDQALKQSPSSFARCICLHWRERSNLKAHSLKLKLPGRKVRCFKFQYKYQTRKLQPITLPSDHGITRFDFGVPSPDDYVKLSQQAAFTRTGQMVAGKK